jgi:hypothetical protein
MTINFLFGYQFNETGMLKTTLLLFYSSTKKDVIVNAPSEVEWQ